MRCDNNDHVTQRQLDDFRNLLDERYTTQTKALDAAFLSAEKAVSKAETSADKRFELLNELRVGVATKDELDALEKLVVTLSSRIDMTQGVETGRQWNWNTIITVILAVAAIAGVIGHNFAG